jgi:hypothetical protein
MLAQQCSYHLGDLGCACEQVLAQEHDDAGQVSVSVLGQGHELHH